MKSLKILMICDFFNENLEFQENIIAKYYIKFGHQVSIITSTYENVFDYYESNHDNSIPMRRYSFEGISIIKLPYRYNFFNKIRGFNSIKPYLKEIMPDLIYIHGVIPNMLECRGYLRNFPASRMIMDCHADYSNTGKNFISLRILHGLLKRYLFIEPSRKYLSKIFAVVPSGYRFLKEIYGIPDQEMEVLPLGVDIDMLNLVKEKRSRQTRRTELGLGDKDILIITGGKLSPRKRTELLIEAIKKIGRKNVHLIIIGESSELNTEYFNMLEDSAKGNNNIKFLGWLSSEDIYHYLLASDIAVFPASQSILWQRAIAAELPLIVGDSGGQSIEYLNLADNIIILQKDSIEIDSIKSSILYLLDNKDTRRKMSEGAKSVRDKMLDWSQLHKRTLHFNTDS